MQKLPTPVLCMLISACGDKPQSVVATTDHDGRVRRIEKDVRHDGLRLRYRRFNAGHVAHAARGKRELSVRVQASRGRGRRVTNITT